MFHLEKSISDWRKKMLAAGITTPAPLDELEIHLREEIEQQMKSGLSEMVALEIAIQQVGHGNSLNEEFEKTRAAKEMRDWKPKEILSSASLAVISSFIAALLIFKIGNARELTAAQQISGLAALAAMVLLAAGGRWLHRIFPVIGSKRIRGLVCIFAGALTVLFEIIFFLVIVPRVNFTLGQLIVALLWAMMLPTGILFGLITGIETAAAKRSFARDS